MTSANLDGAGAPVAAPSDEALVERARSGDMGSFEELVARHEEKLYRVTMRLLRNETDAREVLQDAFLSAWQNLDQFAGRAQFGTWIYRVAVNAALMLLRARRRHPSVSTEDLGSLEAALEQSPAAASAQPSDWFRRPDEQLQSAELMRHVQQAVDGLPELLRVAFVLRDVEGLSTEETADILGVTIPTVKTRLHRARLALRGAITEYFGKS
jgi:RNA polymerase sigma-70 factor (ECF subfamily)